MKLKCLLAMLLLTFLSCSNTPAVEDKIDSLIGELDDYLRK